MRLIAPFLILISSYSFSQEIDSTEVETILKIKNPHNKEQTKWLKKQGFEVDTYQWNNDSINLHLRKALTNRNYRDGLAYSGGALIVLNFIGNVLGELGDLAENTDREKFEPKHGLYMIGTMMLLSSVLFDKKAKQEASIAKKHR